MPPQVPPSEKLDPQIDELSAKYAAAAASIATLLSGAAAGAATPAALRQSSQAVQGTLQALLSVTVLWINLHVPRIYMRGVQGSLAAVEGGSEDELRRQVQEAMKKIEHRVAMETLAQALHDDLQGAVEGMGRDANRTLGEIRRRNVQQALAKGSPLSQTEQFASDLRERGLTEQTKRGLKFTDKSGRKWDPEAYAQMVLRTHVASILNYGHLNKALEMGSLYVHVFDGGPGDVDEPCRRANGQVWHVSHAIAEPLEHPNCRRSFAALDPSYSGKVDRDTGEAA